MASLTIHVHYLDHSYTRVCSHQTVFIPSEKVNPDYGVKKETQTIGMQNGT